MPSIDDQLKDRLQRSAPWPAGADDLLTRLGARKRRREASRKAGTVALVACVLLATLGTFLALGRAFRTGPTPAVSPPSTANGSIVVSIPNEDSFHLMILPPERQDLDPSDGTTTAGFDSMERLTWDPGTQDTDPAVSPDGTTVAFVRKDSTDVPPSLWLIGIDGTHERQVTRAPAGVQSPTWSPDGSLIAFSAADEPEGRALYTIHPDGSDLQMLVNGQDVEGVSWSPDGRSLVYSGADLTIPGGSYDLWEVALDGSAPTDLMPTASSNETEPSWSPDGNTIAYVGSDGIMGVPSNGGESRLLAPAPAGEDDVTRSLGEPAWSPDGSLLTFVGVTGTSPVADTVFALPTKATQAFPLVRASSFGWQPVPLTSPSPSVDDLGLDFAICRVMSMPITVSGVGGNAYVFTREDSDCPKAGEGDRFVAADLNGDGLVDTSPVQLHGCFPPVGCEAFAAPDVNGDGTSEIAVSNAGADGYGVWLYAITSSPPSMDPVRVDLPTGFRGFIQAGVLQLAWVDIATHFEGARCVTFNDGSLGFEIDSGEKLNARAHVRSEVFILEGNILRALDAGDGTMALSDAPVPGDTFCDAPLYGSAADFPGSAS